MSSDLLPELISQYASLDDVPANHIDSVLALRLDEVEEDPDQPRRDFNEEALARLHFDMNRHGQRMPIVVRPVLNGKYRIVHGARRYRAAHQGSWKHIRAIVEKDSARCDDFAQWAENAKRDDLTPIEVALFIDKHVKAGKTQREVAALMGEGDAFVSLHLALLNAPEMIRAAYDCGRIAAVRSVYDLSRLSLRNPDAVKSFMASHDDISRRLVQELAASLSDNPHSSDLDEAPKNTDRAVAERSMMPLRTLSDVGPSTRSNVKSSNPLPQEDGAQVPATRMTRVVPGLESGQPLAPPDLHRRRIIQPLLKGAYQAHPVVVLLDRLPSAIGRVYVRHEEGGDEFEIDIAAITNRSLTDARE